MHPQTLRMYESPRADRAQAVAEGHAPVLPGGRRATAPDPGDDRRAGDEPGRGRARVRARAAAGGELTQGGGAGEARRCSCRPRCSGWRRCGGSCGPRSCPTWGAASWCAPRTCVARRRAARAAVAQRVCNDLEARAPICGRDQALSNQRRSRGAGNCRHDRGVDTSMRITSRSAAMAAAFAVALSLWAPTALAAGPVAGAARVGSAPAQQQLTVLLPLKVDQRGLAAFATAVSTPGSAQYGHYASMSTLARRFGAPSAVRARVISFLHRAGRDACGGRPHRSGRLGDPVGGPRAAAVRHAPVLIPDRHEVGRGEVRRARERHARARRPCRRRDRGRRSRHAAAGADARAGADSRWAAAPTGSAALAALLRPLSRQPRQRLSAPHRHRVRLRRRPPEIREASPRTST